jgi:hypothetical protein
MDRVEIVTDGDGDYYGLAFDCPGCGYGHMVHTNQVPGGMTESKHVEGKPHWDWNCSMEFPTFKPSVKTWVTVHGRDEKVCHSFVTDGAIRFLGDCHHDLKGKMVPLPAIGDDDA